MHFSDIVFYFVSFLIYLIPAFVLNVFFIMQSKYDKPRPLLSAGINFLVCSLIFLLSIIRIITTNKSPGAGDIVMIVPVVEIAMLVMLPFVAIVLQLLSPLIQRYTSRWKSKQIHAKKMSVLGVIFIYIVLGFVVLSLPIFS